MQFPIRVFFENEYLDFPNEKIFSGFFINYIKIKAAGGIVLNKEKKVLMIFRESKWDFPKGKIEQGESPESAALREVSEETGICHPDIIRQLPSTFHTYQLNGNFILKETFWFEMHGNSKKEPVPQTEENITLAQWISEDLVEDNLKNSYPSLSALWQHIKL